MYNIICPIKVNKKNFDLFWPASQKFFRHIKKSKEFDTEENIRRSFSEFMINSIDTKLNAFHITIWYSKIYLIANTAAISTEIRQVDKKIVKYKSSATISLWPSFLSVAKELWPSFLSVAKEL